MRALKSRQAALLAMQQEAETKLALTKQKSNEARSLSNAIEEAAISMTNRVDSLSAIGAGTESNATRQQQTDPELLDIRQQLQYLRNELKTQDQNLQQAQAGGRNLQSNKPKDIRPKTQPPPRPPSPKFADRPQNQREQQTVPECIPPTEMTRDQLQMRLQELLGKKDRLDQLIQEEFSSPMLPMPTSDMNRDELQDKLRELQDKKKRMDVMLQELQSLRTNPALMLNNAGATAPTPPPSEVDPVAASIEGTENLSSGVIDLLDAKQKLQKLNEVKGKLSQLKSLVHFYQSTEDGLDSRQMDAENQSSLPAYSDYSGENEPTRDRGVNDEIEQLKQDVMNRDNGIKSLTEVCKVNQEKARKQADEAHRKVKQLEQKKDDEIKSCKEESKRLEKYVTKLEQNKASLEEVLDKKMEKISACKDNIDYLKRKMAEAKKEIKDLQKSQEKLEKDLYKEKEYHKKDIEAKNNLEDENTKLKRENHRLSSFEQAYYSVAKQITDAGQEIKKQRSTIQSQECKINWYRNENKSKAEMISSLEDEKESLLLRLSKTPDAQLTVSNPNIADLSDDKRPTKLAEEFSEIYDNEWTDAFECIDADNDDRKTKVLYDLLKRSYEFCDTLSTRHYEAIIKSFTTLNYTMKFLKQNIDVKNSNMLSDRQDITDEVRTSANKENDNMVQTVQNYRQSSFKNTARSKPPSEKQYTEAEVTADTKELLIERECVEIRNDVTEVTVSELMFNLDDFSAEQKKTILDLRKLCEEKQANDVVQVGSKLIAAEMQIENGEIMKYLSKCIDVCWSMRQHTPPVFIDYSKREEGLPFDKQKYRPYTRSGKFVQFVVWPVLYLHKGGPQLSKGVAQGIN